MDGKQAEEEINDIALENWGTNLASLGLDRAALISEGLAKSEADVMQT